MTTATADPPAPAAPALLTPEDLLRMPDEGRGYELVDGQLHELNVSAESSGIGGLLYALVLVHSQTRQPGWVFPADTSFQCFPDAPGKVRRPDGAFIALNRYTAEQYRSEGHISVCPDLVIEVVSPNDRSGGVARKVREWLRAGVSRVWLVQPEARTVYVHHTGGADEVPEGETLTGDPVLPGFACPVADLFRLPGQPA